MKFAAKLEKILTQRNQSRSALGRLVGISATAVNDYISQSYLPRIDIALKISRALNVPLDWLADDAQEWPPPMSEARPLSVHQLMLQVSKRWRDLAEALLDKYDVIEKFKWHEVKAALVTWSADGGQPPPKIAAEAIPLMVDTASLLRMITLEFNPRLFVSELGESARPASDFSEAFMAARKRTALDAMMVAEPELDKLNLPGEIIGNLFMDIAREKWGADLTEDEVLARVASAMSGLGKALRERVGQVVEQAAARGEGKLSMQDAFDRLATSGQNESQSMPQGKPTAIPDVKAPRSSSPDKREHGQRQRERKDHL